MKKGLVQVYTGDGKGKTTAALGLAVRAAGHGLKVYIMQFLKSQRLISGEIKIQKHLKGYIKIERLNTPWWSLKSFKRKGDIERLKRVLRGRWDSLKDIIVSQEYDVIILDEINNCLHHKFVDIKSMIKLIKDRPYNTELILTGRDAPEEIMEIADLVTEMKCIKHPYSLSVKARRGIEY